MIYLVAFILLHPLLAVLFVAWARTRSRWIAAPAFVLDVFLNYTTASVLWGWPRRGEWTISQRLRRAQTRNQLAARVLVRWLNRHDPGHVEVM